MNANVSIERNATIEWPTVALFAVIYIAFFALTWFHASIPLWLWLPLAIWFSAWWGSAQHEALHGHPTRLLWLNTALATPPLWLWLPFARYKQSHLTHHRDERLTDPLDDPESRYWTPDGWKELGPLGQLIVKAQNTLLGRLTIGPFWSVGMFWRAEALALIAGDHGKRVIWAWHMLWVVLLLTWVVGICDVPFWQYAIGFGYFGTAVALIRSFAEHRAYDSVDKRTAIVENSPVFGLLFLNNNLHVAHHKWPTAAWYKLPKLYHDNRAQMLTENGGLLYSGYGEVFRRFFLKQHDQPVHPTGRVPPAGSDQAGKA